MAFVLADRVQQTGTANTTVSFTLSGSVTGFQAFTVIGNTNTTYYAATDVTGNWEVGIGTYATSGPTLTRTTILASSNSGSAVTFSGTVNVFVTYPSSKSVNLDGSGNVSGLGTVSSGTWQGTAIGVLYGGTGQTSYTNGQLLIGNSTGNTLTKATLSAGTGISITNGTGSISIASTTTGTVTSVAATVPAFLSVAGSPITTSGTLAITLSGTALPVANGGTGVTTSTGSGNNVLSTSPTLTTPVLGTPTSGTLSNCTVDGTDAVGFRNVPVNSQSAAYTTVLADSGKVIFHPSSDANARTFTIPANSSVAYPIGTAITFINMTSQVVTIAITTDTMYLSSAGTTGSRSLAQYGSATALKITSTNWLISGSGLT